MFTVTVIEAAPLVGVDLPIEKIPAPVQVATSEAIERSGALELSAFLNRRFNGVFVNEIQSNPFQPDINYRGYTASPLLGTPQGLSVYMDGVRLNQPFGDVVSWDLIPRLAISSTTVMPGSNPLFGLNTLGGAIAIQTKTGLTNRGTSVQAIYGSDVRRSIELEHGGQKANGLHWYLAGNLFGEDGWRADSPSDVRQGFAKIGVHRLKHDAALTLGHADNSLNGNGLQEQGFLDREYASVYTKPDTTKNRSTFLNFTTRHRLNGGLALSGNAYYRDIHTDALNGDINEDSLDQAIYQPSAAEQAALAAAGFSGFPTSGADASNTPFPSWRCLGNVLLNDEPAEKCNGLINRTETSQQNGGAFAQLTLGSDVARGRNQFMAGAGYDRSRVGFLQSTELGYLNPDRSVTGVNAFGDGETGGEIDGEPYDTRVDLDGLIQTFSIYATDTITIADAWNITVSGRYNRTTIRNRDILEPGGGSESLDGDHRFSRFNPAAGVTFSPSRTLNIYGGYSEGSRAATSIELGCANPEEPCKLPNAMAGDPPLDQVVTRTWEAGARGEHRGVTWSAGLFRSDNRSDILFVMSDQTGFGYFRNFGETRRKGFDLSASRQLGRLTVGTGYTFLAATYESEETVNGESNSSNDRAEGRSARPRRRDRDRPRRSHPAHSPTSVQGVRGGATLIQRIPGHRSRGGVERVRAWERKQSTPGRRHLLSRAGLLSWILGRESRRHVSAQALDADRRADHQPLRSTLLHGRPARGVGFHEQRRVRRQAVSRRQRRVPSAARHVLRTGRTHTDVDRHEVQVLNDR